MTCQHERIRAWRFEDTDEPAQMWSCADCHHRFEPARVVEPLSLERIFSAADTAGRAIVADDRITWLEAFARAVERMHGIT